MIEKQFEELKHSGQLPSPTGVGLEILRLLQEPDEPLDELIQCIRVDPALTGRIIKIASAAAITRSVPVSTVQEAAVRLGFRAVSNVALGFSLVAGSREGACAEFDYDRYWSHSLAMAVACQVFSAHLRVGNPHECFTLGLLGRVGELALASVHPGLYGEVLSSTRENPTLDVLRVETEAFNINQREVTSFMLMDWGLPATFSQTVELLGHEKPGIEDAEVLGMLKVLRCAWKVADFCTADSKAQQDILSQLQVAAEAAGLTGDDVQQLGAVIATHWREWGETLKVETAEVPKMVPVALTGADGRKEQVRILAVDDDRVALKLLAKHLEQDGNVVEVASNGKEALGKALEFDPHIVVTDWMMPEMDGVQLCKALRLYPSGRKKYILLLTGRAEEDRVVEAFDAGADDYIVKPFKPKLLLARIRAGKRMVLLQQQVEREKKVQRDQMAKLQLLTRKLREAAMTDTLTELANRRYVMKRLETEWSTAERSGRPLAAVLLDIDHFKQVNDKYGHDTGDLVLQSVAKVLTESVRRGDTVARIGGEEFLVLCPNTELEEAIQVAERVRSSTERELIKSGTFEGNVTMSGGVAVRSATMKGKDELLKLADEACYESKRNGRNQISVARGSWGTRESA